MSRFLLFFLCFQHFSVVVMAQNLRGRVTDAANGQALTGVNVVVGAGRGTTTDLRGEFTLDSKNLDFPLQLEFSYIGYEAQSVQLKSLTEKPIDIKLKEKTGELQQVVVTASRFAQRTATSPVSMQVVKQAAVLANNSVTADDALHRTPGIHVLRGQINIRGSSGFTYGVGSRVMVLLDGLPLLTAESGEARWNMLPVENLEQIEIIKGAGSAMYGSAALGGVVHFRTAMPGDKPVTQVNWFNSFYGPPPPRHSDPYAGNQYPVSMGLGLAHRQKVGKLEFSGSMNLVNDDGYRIGEPSRRYRFNAHVRYQLAKGLYAGLSASHLIDSTRLYTFWVNDTNAYAPAATATIAQYNQRSFIDPYLEYTGKNSRHSLRNRFFRSNTNYNNEDFGQGDMYYTEYQYQRFLKLRGFKQSILTAGAVNQINSITSGIIYGQQRTVNRSVYAQWDQQWRFISFGLGFRHEQLLVNDTLKEQNPVFRAGINVALGPNTNLRASMGEGFRSATVAEMFSNTRIGTIRLASDPQLKPEESRSFEIGVVQQLNAGRYRSQLDLALFRTDYRNMIEYGFLVRLPERFDAEDSVWINNNQLNRVVEKYARFQPSNIAASRITGVEMVYSGRADWKRWGFQFELGYTYTNPINLNPPASLFNLPADIMKYLKYRYLHLARTDVQFRLGSWMLGANVRYNSVILNIDEDYYRFIPGLIDYRLSTIRGDLITDLRGGCAINEHFRLNMVVRNAGNVSYMPVPGNIGEQRTWVLQMLATF